MSAYIVLVLWVLGVGTAVVAGLGAASALLQRRQDDLHLRAKRTVEDELGSDIAALVDDPR